MIEDRNRRRVLKQLAAVSASLVLPRPILALGGGAEEHATDFDVRIARVSDHTFRWTILPVHDGKPAQVPLDGSLVQAAFDGAVTTLQHKSPTRTIEVGQMNIHASLDPFSIVISSSTGARIQTLSMDRASGIVSFEKGNSPLLGLGEGGPQFDRRGSVDTMVSGQGGYRLETHGSRVPIPWIIGTEGWAIFFHQPYGSFDFSGATAKFIPKESNDKFPLDLFFVASRDPATILHEYVRLTGHPELPPLWSLGYQQSHRTLASREEVLAEAKTFREKKLPCDALIYLGTGFCPSGWNTENGSFSWNSRVFPDPAKMIDELHKEDFRVVLHDVILTDRLRGSVHDPCTLSEFDEEQASCYWDAHRKDFALGVDGWWPDEGDPLDVPSRLVRNRMHWEGPQLDRPNERPYALHRNGYAGMQRYASFLWSGDVYSKWETLKTQVPIAINTSLSGVPYWGTDIGGFVPTKEFTAELFVRWFQFGAFCPLFRAHGRTWKLRLPWGWNTGDPGPVEIRNDGSAATPDASELHDERVELICRKYLDLRYRMLPYIYSAVHESTQTGIPIMRAMWIHYPDDATAVACPDQFLWGRDILVAPVVEKEATTRTLYLPRGTWYDFWTGEKSEGSHQTERHIDLETMPLYLRAGTILPMGPVRQHTSQEVDEPLQLTIYPGADGSFRLYEDDGISFNYRKGEWMGVDLKWEDARRRLTVQLAARSRMLPPGRREFKVTLENKSRAIVFDGKPLDVSL